MCEELNLPLLGRVPLDPRIGTQDFTTHLSVSDKTAFCTQPALDGQAMRKFQQIHSAIAVRPISLICRGRFLVFKIKCSQYKEPLLNQKSPSAVPNKCLMQGLQQAVSSSLNVVPYFKGKSCDEGKSFLSEVPDSPAAMAYQSIVQSKLQPTPYPHINSSTLTVLVLMCDLSHIYNEQRQFYYKLGVPNSARGR